MRPTFLFFRNEKMGYSKAKQSLIKKINKKIKKGVDSILKVCIMVSENLIKTDKKGK